MGVVLSRRSLIFGIPALIAAERLMRLSIPPFYPDKWVESAGNFGLAIYHPRYTPKVGEIIDLKHPGALTPGKYKVLWQETGKRNSSSVWNNVVKIA